MPALAVMPEMDEIREHIKLAANEAAQECTELAEQNDLASTLYDRWNLILGIPATVLAAITSVSALSNIVPYFFPSWNKDIVTGLLAIVVAVLTALITYLTPNEKSNSYNSASANFNALKTKIKFLEEIDVDSDESTNEVKKKLEDFINQLSELRRNSPRIPSSSRKQQEKLARVRAATPRP
jgi:hypothetical protein